MSGWLVAQLPRVLAQDRFTQRFVSIFEEMIDEVRTQIDSIEDYIDVGTAPPEFVRWLGSWLDVTVDAGLPDDRQREIVREAGRLFARRGTVGGLRGVLETITGAEVRVVDGGGTWRQGEAPLNPGRLLVRLTDTGGVPEEQLWRLIAAEVPIGTTFEVRLDERTLAEPVAPQGVMEALAEGHETPAPPMEELQDDGLADAGDTPPPLTEGQESP
ncbi:MAG: phage tail protein [Dehalococcoidia bacterium]